MRFLYSLLVLFVILFYSCDDKPCYEEMNTYFKIGFYQVKNGNVSDSILDSLKIYADQSNFVLAKKKARFIYPELSPHSDTTLFFLNVNNNVGDDYIRIGYNRKYHLVSHDCGFLTFFDNIKILEHSTTFIDSVVVENSSVNDVNQEQIKIYL